MRSPAKDIGLVALAAGGTLLVLAAYEGLQRLSRGPGPQATPVPTKLAAAPGRASVIPQSTSTQPATPDHSSAPPDAAAAAHATLGPDGEVLAYGDFPSAGGRQILVVQRVPPAPGQPPQSPENTTAQVDETAAEVVRVSILVTDGKTWKEAFRADEHLKNRRGYLPGAPAESVSAWLLACSKTPESGFLLRFTPRNPPSGRKAVTVTVGWNPTREEYDEMAASGKGFLDPARTPGKVPIPIRP